MTNAELAILSLLSEQPRHGYEIEQVITERGMRNWTDIGFSSIYYLLNKLAKDGLVESTPGPSKGRGPGRKIYSPTPAGQHVLQAGLIEAISRPHYAPNPFLLAIGNLPAIPAASALEGLRQYAAALRERLAGLEAVQSRQQPLPSFVNALFGYSLVLTRAELEWVEKFTKELSHETI
jgi:DNA-binding PadR family transcriptional regulator